MTTGERIRALRELRGMTMEQLAKEIGSGGGRQQVWNWENGRGITELMLVRIAHALDTTPAYLRYGIAQE